MFRKSALAAAFLMLTSPGLLALGLGEINMQSALNQPMQAVIYLTSSRETDLADIEVSLASLQDHQRAGLTKAEVLAGFRFDVVRDESGGAMVRITSTDPVREPYLEFLLELDWPKGRLLRQYTVLIDPPVTMPATPVAPQIPVTRAATSQPQRQPLATPITSPGAPAVAPATVAAADEYGPIRRNETLWSVAERLRPGKDVSMHQMMQALLRANPNAFVNNNINHMKAGVTLKVPGREEILSMSAREAAAESRRQYSEWNAANAAAAAEQVSVSKEPPAGQAPDAEEPPAEQVAEQAPDADVTEADAAEPPATAAQTETRLTLMTPEDDSITGAAAPGAAVDAEVEPGSIADLTMQLALATEEAEAGRAQSMELQSRVAELEQQIDTMKRLLELKDHALAQLQSNTESNAEQATSPGAEVSETDTAAADAPGADDQPANIMGRLMDNPLLAGAGVLVALLLGIFLWVASRQKSHADLFGDDDTLEKRLAQESAATVPGVATPVDVQEQSWEHAPQQHMESGEQDALTEADVYLAYGRIQQAEDVLQAALQDDPGNDTYQLKLLEVYHAAGNVAAFVQAASAYRERVPADDSRWLKVAEMGREIAPHNEMFAAADRGADFDMDLSGMDHLPDAEGIDNQLPDSVEFSFDDVGPEHEDEQEGVLASEDEVTTKLDLARAYIDMDDQDSARSILGEVIQEGNETQKQEAEKIMAQLA